MEKLDEKDLLAIVGGINIGTITGAFINALVSAGKSIYSAGQSLGSSLRRIQGNNLCPIK